MNNLQDRSIIEISGADRKKFLQGLVTNDVNKASANSLIYSVMLNAQGRFLYDFFIFEQADKLLLDCSAIRRDEIIKKLNFYKLRSQVEIKKNEEILIAQSLENIGFNDPRSANLGYRIYKTNAQLEEISGKLLSPDNYHFLRIKNKIAEGEVDLTFEKSLILEFDFDSINAINYEKGCYIGQELTARTHYLGEIRKKLFHIKITNQKILPQKGEEISCEGKTLGVILSSILFKDEVNALALIRLQDENTNLETKLEAVGIKLIS